MIDTLIMTIHIFVSLFMILVVLIQGGNSGGMGAALGGSNTQGVFGAGGANTLLTRATYAAAMIFMLTSLTLTIRNNQNASSGLLDQIEAKPAATSTEVPAITPDTPTTTTEPTEAPATTPAAENEN